MVNKIIDSISEALINEFGMDYKVYDEGVEQGMKLPCFFINTGDLGEEQKLGNRYLLTNPFTIQYLSSSKEKKRDCNDIRDKLIKCLEYINVDNSLIRGTKMSSNYSDGILTFNVNYDFFVMKYKKANQKLENYNLSNEVESDKNGKKRK